MSTASQPHPAVQTSHPPSKPSSENLTKPDKKRRDRKDRPCDACRRRKSKCVINDGETVCAACRMHNQQCTYVEDPRPRKRRVDGDGQGQESAKKRCAYIYRLRDQIAEIVLGKLQIPRPPKMSPRSSAKSRKLRLRQTPRLGGGTTTVPTSATPPNWSPCCSIYPATQEQHRGVPTTKNPTTEMPSSRSATGTTKTHKQPPYKQ